MKKSAYWVQAFVFFIFIIFFSVLNFATPDRLFSDQENRYLQTAPNFTFNELFSGKFSSKFENYTTDQFPFRDSWITLKARSELLSGKSSNNGIYYCKGDTLIEPFTTIDDTELLFRLDYINTFQSQIDIPVFFALIPSISEIHPELLPPGAPNDSQRAIINKAYEYFNGKTVDIYSALLSHCDEPLFYRTDHHWTSLGAYYGYVAIANSMGFAFSPITEYNKTCVCSDFLGSAYSASGFSWVSPDIIETYVSQGNEIIINYPNGSPVKSSLYDSSALESKDKYKYFYGGNTPLLYIKTEHSESPSLLILRDSYMDSLSPFLLADFSEIHILDLRYYHTSLKQYLDEHDIDNILICYSVKNFCEDGNLFWITN